MFSEHVSAHGIIRWRPVDYIPRFKCKCGCGNYKMDRDFLNRFQKVRAEWFKETGKDLVRSVSSGYRCNAHNRRVSRYASKIDGSGPHTKGKAVDVKVSGKDAKKLFKIARKYMSGIGLAQRSRRKKNRYIHMDTLTAAEAPRPTVWRYN